MYDCIYVWLEEVSKRKAQSRSLGEKLVSFLLGGSSDMRVGNKKQYVEMLTSLNLCVDREESNF